MCAVRTRMTCDVSLICPWYSWLSLPCFSSLAGFNALYALALKARACVATAAPGVINASHELSHSRYLANV